MPAVSIGHSPIFSSFLFLFAVCLLAIYVRGGREAFRACSENCRFPEVFPYACSTSLAQAQNPKDHPQAPFATGRPISYRTNAASSIYPKPLYHRRAPPHSTTHTATACGRAARERDSTRYISLPARSAAHPSRRNRTVPAKGGRSGDENG